MTLTFAFLAWAPLIIGSLLILWDLARTEPIEPAKRYSYDYRTDSYNTFPSR